MFRSKKPNSSRGVRQARKFHLRTDASRDTRCSCALNTQLPPRNCWTRYPPRYSNGWAEFWSEPMKLIVDKLNHAHWLRMNNIWFSGGGGGRGHSDMQVHTCMNSGLKYTPKHSLVMMQKSPLNKDFVRFCLKFDSLRGYCTFYPKLACFVLYLKIINTF